MTSHEQRLAFNYGCQLLADLLEGNFNKSVQSGIKKIPLLHDAWQHMYGDSAEKAEWDFHRTLTMDVLPYAGLYFEHLDISHIPSLDSSVRPDHFSNLLRLAARDQSPTSLTTMILKQTYIPFVNALRDHPFYGAVGTLFTNIVSTWEDAASSNMDGVQKNANIDLKELSNILSKPDHIGFWIGPSLIHAWATQLDVPVVFGNRCQMIDGLLHHAADYEKFDKYLQLVGHKVQKELDELCSQPSQDDAAFWKSVLEDSQQWLSQLSSNLQAMESEMR
jgi:hypothetical protein